MMGSSPQTPPLDELAGSTVDDPGWTVSLEDSGVSAELVGSVAELLDSSAAEMASMSELLIGSWLSGMSIVWLELLGTFST